MSNQLFIQKIVPHLWYDKEAREAAEFYVSLFPDSQVTNITTLHQTPSGNSEIVSFELWGQKFMAISAGPHFTINPSISFTVNFNMATDGDAREKLDEVWNKLADGGVALMPLDAYPFSERFGWIQDKYGLTWQLMLTNSIEAARPKIVPSLLFVGDVCGRTEEAIELYLSIFQHAKLGTLTRYSAGMDPDREGTVMFADFTLEQQWFTAMDSAHKHHFMFNEAVSFMVYCDTQEEIDYYWDKLSAVPAAEQCGWLKDKFGISWQIVPSMMDEMMRSGTPAQIAALTEAFLPMKKFDLEKLQQAFNQVTD